MIVTAEFFSQANPTSKHVGVTSGCFDLLHFYHLRYLERCREQCEFLIVGVDSDRLILRHKGKAPVISEHERAAMVNALRCVDAVWIMREVAELHRVARGARVAFKHAPTIYGNSFTPPSGCELVIVPDIEALTSTTAILRRAQATALPA